MHDVNLDSLDRLNCPHCGLAFEAPMPEPFSEVTCEQCQMASVVPGKFGQFLLYKIQTESVTSIVFDAFDPKLGRNVTLKILNYVLSKNPELVEAFKHEALAAAALNSTYVLKVYEFGIHNHQPFMVMEHIEGKFLHEVIQQENLSEIRIVDILDGIVQGLEDMHQQGIMHGDVMPRNILIHTDGSPRISDFGLARFSGETNDNSQTQQWESWSSPYYMPPERILGEKEDHRGDFYSLGTTLFNLLTGELPFFDLDESIILKRKVEEFPPDPRETRSEISDDMAELSGYLMQRKPEDRPANYDELRSLLAHIKSSMPKQEKEIPEPDLIPDYHQNTRKKKEPIAWFVLLVLSGILITMLISLMTREKEEAPPTAPTATTIPPTPTPIPTATETPAPTSTPRPRPTPVPTAIPPKTVDLATILNSPGRQVYLKTDLIEPLQNMRVEDWKDVKTGKSIFMQKNPALQPRKIIRGNSDPVLNFQNSQMISILQPNQMEAFTLLTILSLADTTDRRDSSFILGIDPSAPNLNKFYIKTHPSLNAAFIFGSGKKTAILTLPFDERTKPFLVGFIRGPEGDRAFLGSATTLLSGSSSNKTAENNGIFEGFQLGGLEPGKDFFNGWFGDFLFYSEALSIQEFRILADDLYQRFKAQP